MPMGRELDAAGAVFTRRARRGRSRLAWPIAVTWMLLLSLLSWLPVAWFLLRVI